MVAQNNAKDNGPLLAQFIIDFNETCPDSHIRVIAHSLGAAVVESTLASLDSNSTLQDSISNNNNSGNNNNSKLIKSIHLLAAAINNKLMVKNSAFANATEHLVDKFYNLYSPEDDGLQFNREYERHDPLGLVGPPPGMLLQIIMIQMWPMKYLHYLMLMGMVMRKNVLRISNLQVYGETTIADTLALDNLLQVR